MTPSASQIIHALVEAELVAEQREAHRYRPRGRVVTLAHELGSGGRAIARTLADRLSVQYYDREVLHAMIAMLPEEKVLLERLDQQVSTGWQEVLHEIISGRSALDEYRRHLIMVILAIGRKSGVIVGRGAHLILAKHKVFRVSVVGSVDVCAQRLLKTVEPNGQLRFDEAKRRVLKAREDNPAFIEQLLGRESDEPGAFDLIINTDYIGVEAAPDIILSAMGQAGFDVSRQDTGPTLRYPHKINHRLPGHG